ncbi:MAG: Lrp/AsnC family transcriptional regulator [Devosia sp.]|uniref:Lrp/AsnC family transcriptional regulator n=1 Tax=Devosia sp. TaxID=1871048 RepID=UPI0024C70C0B|nr:Lrp/AsnC family transcriptional regulator [Devosia sp.]UYO01424.1 MAG: Lrp/AsnC family transcriptional regulator [Devosia sp.]
MLKLDDRDIRLLSILAQEGRISKTELARRVHLSPTPCWERLQRLEKAGLIKGYRAEIALAGIAPHVTVLVLAELDNHRAETMTAFERAIGLYDEITQCWALGGGFDYLFQVITTDIDAYQRLIDDLLSRKAGLSRYFTYVVTKHIKGTGVPPLELLLGARARE